MEAERAGLCLKHSMPALPAACHCALGRGSATLQSHSHAALTLPYQGHMVEGVGSRIGNAQLTVCMLEWC